MADLISLDEFKELQGISSTNDDVKLEILIPSVSQLVKTYCGNSIIDYYATNKEEIISIEWNTSMVQLDEGPVNSLVSVSVRERPTDSFQVLDASEYFLDTKTDSVVYLNDGRAKDWPIGLGTVKVVYTAGYSSTPADLKLAVADLVNYYLKDEHKQRQTLSGATIENQGTGSGRGFPDHIKRILDMYKVH